MATITEALEMIISADVAEAKKNIEDLEKSVESLKDTTGELDRQTQDASDSFDDFRESAGSAGTSSSQLMESLFSQAAGWLSVSAAIAKTVQILSEADAAATEERIGMARLQAVLDATGRSAEISAKRIDDFASKLEDSIKIDKQAIIDATSALSTMGDVSTDLFDKVFTAAADMAATFGTDIGSAISSLGYALESPTEGISRLRRQGIFISEEMASQIEYLTEQNRKYEAQTLLLDEISKKVEGTAKAIADASATATLSTSWGKFLGELGKTFEGTTGMFKGAAAGLLDFFTGIMEEGNSFKEFLAVDVEALSKMSISELEDYLEEAKKWLEDSKTDYAINQWQTMVDAAQSYLDIAVQAKAAEDERAEAEAKQAEEARTYSEELESQKALTSELSAMWASTDAGSMAALESQIERLSALREADKAILLTLADPAIIAEVQARLAMYDAIIAGKQKQLDGLTGTKAAEVTPADILGKSADEYIMAIPVSFDFGRSNKEQLEAELSALKSAIEALWSKRPEEMTDEWQGSLDILLGKYNEVSEQISAITDAEKEQQKQIDLKSKAESELGKLLSDEEQAKKALSDYDKEIKQLVEAKVITEDQYNALLDTEARKLGLITDELSDQEKAQAALSDSWDSFANQLFSVEAMTSRLTDAFMDIGEALATNGDAADAAAGAAARFSEEIASSLTELAISAGLRCIAEGNLAIGLALLAIGGITGLGAGAMGASGKAISDEMQRELDEELKARKKLTEQINSSIDQEYQLLKRQLDRNLITEEDFISSASVLQHQRDVADARSGLSDAVMSRINELNTEYSRMNSWDKFWSGRDEDILDEISELKNYYSGIDTATEDELRALLDTLASLGVSTGGIAKFASGGEFTTTGPRLIAVGDNPGGVERVSITPADSQRNGGTTIIISGDVYGWEDMVGKLKAANAKIERRRI